MIDSVFNIISNKLVAEDIYELILSCDHLEPVVAGQFISISTGDSSKLLRRPFCIAGADYDTHQLRVLYQVVGGGTGSIASMPVGESVRGLYPLGNGFDISSYSNILLIGGGMGAVLLPIIISTNKDKHYHTFLGFKNQSKAILVDELKALSDELYIATDWGDLGHHGFVTELVADKIQAIRPDAIICCGPEIMYKSLEKSVDISHIPTFVSLERRMGCGIGACLVCNCKVKTKDGITYKRACKDGPVFELKEIEL